MNKQEADVVEQVKNKENHQKKLYKAMKEFLEGKSKEYSVWFTVTSRRIIDQEEFEKKIKRFFHKLNNGQIQFYDNFLNLLLFYEKYPDGRKGVHIHGLASNIDPKYFSFLSDRLFNEFGESKVESIHENVAQYLTEKYVKDASLDHFMAYRINDHAKRKVNKVWQSSIS